MSSIDSFYNIIYYTIYKMFTIQNLKFERGVLCGNSNYAMVVVMLLLACLLKFASSCGFSTNESQLDSFVSSLTLLCPPLGVSSGAGSTLNACAFRIMTCALLSKTARAVPNTWLALFSKIALADFWNIALDVFLGSLSNSWFML